MAAARDGLYREWSKTLCRIGESLELAVNRRGEVDESLKVVSLAESERVCREVRFLSQSPTSSLTASSIQEHTLAGYFVFK